MPSLTSLLLRYLIVFGFGLLLAFIGLVGLSLLSGRALEGPWGFLAILVIALLAAAQSAGRHIGRVSGRFPSEALAWIFSLLVGVVLLLGFFLFLMWAERGAIDADLPGPQDPAWDRFVLTSCGVFLPLAAILTRFGLFTGAVAGIQGHRRQMAASLAQAGGAAFDPSAGGHAVQAPGVIAVLARLILLNILGSVLLIYALPALERAGYGPGAEASWPSVAVAVMAALLAGQHYGRRAGHAMPSGFAWAVSGLYTLLSVTMTGAILGYLLVRSGASLPRNIEPATAAILLGGTAGVVLLLSLVTKWLLRAGARSALGLARPG